MINGRYDGSSSSSDQSFLLSSLFKWNPAKSGKRKIGNGHRKSGKRKKLPTWTHTFVCLASPTQDALPDADERAMLLIAGLGEKKVLFLAN